MFPKKYLQIQITDERLLSSKRATIKRSANGHNYDLIKKNSIIQIRVLPPVSFKEMVLSFVEAKIDLENPVEGNYQIEIGFYYLVKYIYAFFAVMFPFFFIAMANNTFLGAGVFASFICLVIYFQYHQFLDGMSCLLYTSPSPRDS